MTDTFLPYLPIAAIRAAFAAGRGNEIDSGKIDSPESSSALVANTFGPFITGPVGLLPMKPLTMPELPGLSGCGWPPITVALEQCCRFPWPGGEHPWLDVLIKTKSNLIGIESKRYEPFRPRKAVNFSVAYSRPVWGETMGAYERVRDALANGTVSYTHLDAAQLVKHAFGLRTEGHRLGRTSVLMYLFAEPSHWPDGRPIPLAASELHRAEIRSFSERVTGTEVLFVSCSYRELTAAFGHSPMAEVRDHVAAIETRYAI